MSAFSLLIAAPISEDGLAILRQAPDVTLLLAEESPSAVQPHLAQAQALLVGDHLTVDEGLLQAAPHLHIIARLGATLENIDVEAATRRGIIVMNAPGVDAITVAEYTFTLMLALLRKVLPAHQSLVEGRSLRYVGNQLKGKTLGIIGYGRVGSEVAQRAIAFGLEVLVSDPYVSESQVAGLRIKLVGSDELLSRADIISLHTTLVDDTYHYLNRKRLARTKNGVFIINSKHRDLIQTEEMLEFLESGHVAGLALDDLDAIHSPLIRHPNVLHTQRMRSNTVEAQRDLSTLIAKQLLDALHKRDYRNAINLPFMPGREYDVIQPQMNLAEKIGLMHYVMGRRIAIDRVEIGTQGQEMEGLLKPLTIATLTGLLAPMLGSAVNYINAPLIAHERGITVTQSKHLALDSYPNLLVTRVVWADQFELVIAGAIFNQTEPRIVQVDQYRTDFVPAGTLLIMGSYDVPGVIGQTGMFMASHQINIAGWRTGRVQKGGNTLSIITLDQSLPESLLDELRAKDYVRHVTQITFD
jgi:D-3-phosphoglycerate dehydrogenase